MYTDRTIQRSSEAPGGISDLFTRGLVSLADHIKHQIVTNKTKLKLAGDFTENDVKIKFTDGRDDQLSSVGDVYIELTAVLTSNGEDARSVAMRKLIKIVRHHLQDGGVVGDLDISANIIRVGNP
ncbi:hypothetical protein EON65_57730 [archaeon]|nr:MAG: hypothetical protein EON65_57730 [archaeon]